ncbi:MAG: SRPBCC family protein, partial [Actinomycetota bacterium]|nr:SRPBCC family protein [Actinomycetota bacterium]
TQGTIEIEASPSEIMEVIADFDAYPEWVDGITAAETRERGEDGRPIVVAFEFSAMGFNAAYTLTYEYRPDDAGVRWTTVEATGAVKDVQGGYELEPLNGDTRVTYRLAVDLAVKVPGFLKRQGDKRAIKTALDGLKSRVESA